MASFVEDRRKVNSAYLLKCGFESLPVEGKVLRAMDEPCQGMGRMIEAAL